jgi:hypothetical protein
MRAIDSGHAFQIKAADKSFIRDPVKTGRRKRMNEQQLSVELARISKEKAQD